MNEYQQLFSLKGKTAFVCGGLGLIGLEAVKALLETGAKTIILDNNKNKGEARIRNWKNVYPDVFFEYFDATDGESIEKIIQLLQKKYKKIDIWVNTAYPRTSDWSTDVRNMTLDSWKKNIDMHLVSYSWITREVCLCMTKQQSGSIVNIGSIYGVVGNDPELYTNTGVTAPPAYAAIKGGIVNMTRYMASFFGKYNIRVNTLCPGGVYAHQKKQFVKKYIAKIPLARMAVPKDIASAIVFLGSDASSYITGTTFMVDGGYTCR